MKEMDYYFTSLSPFAYLGQQKLHQLAEKYRVKIHYKPIQLGPVFGASGALPLGQRPKSRQAYRLTELKRWSEFRQQPMNIQPTYFPVDPSLADRCIIALLQRDKEVSAFAGAVMRACWSQEQNIADEDVLTQLLLEHQLDAQDVLSLAKQESTLAQYQANTEEAVAKGVLGSPSYWLQEEQFWGQDRLELLEVALQA